MSDKDVRITTRVSIQADISFDEGELRALDAMVGYGIEPFLEVFYAKLGTHYMKPHEANLRALFVKIGSTVPQALKEVSKARRALQDGAQ